MHSDFLQGSVIKISASTSAASVPRGTQVDMSALRARTDWEEFRWLVPLKVGQRQSIIEPVTGTEDQVSVEVKCE